MIDFRSLYIDTLKKLDDDICEKCKNHVECHGRSCPQFIEGNEGTLDGRPVKFQWDCRDFTFGECPMLEKTPCFQCIEQNHAHFVLDESKLEKQYDSM